MNKEKIKLSLKERIKGISPWFIVYDIFALTAGYFLALWFRFDCMYSLIPNNYLNAWLSFLPIYIVIGITVFVFGRLYSSVWQFAGYDELKRVSFYSFIVCALHTLLITLFFMRMPISYYVFGAAIQFILVLVARFVNRFIITERKRRIKSQNLAVADRVMLIGAGSAGQMILRDLHSAKEINDYVCCIIDDDKSKWGKYVDGVPVVGGREEILLNVEKYKIEKIFVAIPSATAEQRRDILNICKETNCELKNLPGMYELVDGSVTASAMKEVAVEDLLGREPVKVNTDEIGDFIADKVILVTGGGGSIGSELCRQIAKYGPRLLIIFDIYENNAHSIGLELKDKYPSLALEVLIGSVRDSKRLDQIFGKYRPDVVYHAAAHKHVPLMEDSPCEAVKNNAVGTYKTAYAAVRHGCSRFVLISTDKAVNPTNIMGASKRLCEMIIQSFDRKIRNGRGETLFPLFTHESDDTAQLNICNEFKTEFVAVRFGNVLGSNGSVIPRFREQIERGGPVTVTHPDIIRYFMTIPEAASLVLQAGTYAKGGEIFVLDMGSPVKIDTLARNMIRLSGFTPDVDIKISYIGLRPGEKLYEEKLMDEEGMHTTPNKLIYIGNPIPFDEDAFLEKLPSLMSAAYDGCSSNIRTLVQELVPTYNPAGEHGSEEKGKVYQEQIKEIE